MLPSQRREKLLARPSRNAYIGSLSPNLFQGEDGDDNIIFDITEDVNGHPKSADGFGHPHCGADTANEANIAANLPAVSEVAP